VWLWLGVAFAKAPMNGVLVGGSVAGALTVQEPTLDQRVRWLGAGPDFGFELWGTTGRRKGGVRAGILFQLGFTPGGETTRSSLRLGGGPVIGGIWGARKGSYGTAHVGLGAGGAMVGARESDVGSYGSVGVWLRGELASGLPLGKHGVAEIGPYLTLVPPIRVGDDEAPWRGDYWGQVGVELTLMAFGGSRGRRDGASPAPSPAPRPAPVLPVPPPRDRPPPVDLPPIDAPPVDKPPKKKKRRPKKKPKPKDH
jgi:hypothetical protein